MQRPQITAATVAVVALVSNVILIITHEVLRARVTDLQPPRAGQTMPMPIGVGLDGGFVTPQLYESSKCHLTRFESTGCAHCKTDRERFLKLEAFALQHGCSSTLVAPSEVEFPPSVSSQRLQLAFPVLGFSMNAGYRGTPTTRLARSGWLIDWESIGPMGDDDEEAAERIIRKYARLNN